MNPLPASTVVAISIDTATRDDVDYAAESIRAIQNCLWTTDHFNVLNHSGIDGVQELVGPQTKRRVVQANAIDQNQYLLPSQSTYEGRGRSPLSTLHDHTHFVLHGVKHLNGNSFCQLATINQRSKYRILQQRTGNTTSRFKGRSPLISERKQLHA